MLRLATEYLSRNDPPPISFSNTVPVLPSRISKRSGFVGRDEGDDGEEQVCSHEQLTLCSV